MEEKAGFSQLGRTVDRTFLQVLASRRGTEESLLISSLQDLILFPSPSLSELMLDTSKEFKTCSDDWLID